MHTGQDTASSQVETKPISSYEKWIEQRGNMLDQLDRAEAAGHEIVTERLDSGDLVVSVKDNASGKVETIETIASDRAADALSVLFRNTRTVTDDMPGVINRLKQTQGREFLGLSSPDLKQVNDALWGWRGLTFFAAEPGIGKTTYLLQVLGDIVDNNADACVVFFSFEMSSDEIMTRMICRYSGIGYRHLVCGETKADPDDRGFLLGDPYSDMVDGGIDTLSRQGDRVVIIESKDIDNDTSIPGDRVGAMAAKIQEAKQRTGCDRVFVVVDNMQAMPVPVVEYQNDLDRDRETIAALGNMQHILGDPVVVISEQAKGRQGDTRGVTSMLGTGRSGYAADNVLLLHRPAGLDQESANIDDKSVCLELTIAKGRDGVLRKVIPMAFDHHTMIFTETDGELIKEKQEQPTKKPKQKGDGYNWNNEGGSR